ncbi:MAG: hypothetical protein M1268_01120 [Patescibacteria group bacterium]|nr:hypothetical protein [Patescibacteria group bacterium]
MESSINNNVSIPTSQTGAPAPPNTTIPENKIGKIIIVILFYIFLAPIGLILMWLWMKIWPRWLKIILSIFAVIPIIGITGAILLASQNPYKQLGKVKAKITPTQTVSPTPTVDPTANWKTYTNSKFRFSFKYPPDIKISSTSGEFENGLNLEFGKENSGMPILTVWLTTGDYVKGRQNDLNTILSTNKLDDYNYQISAKKIDGKNLYVYTQEFDSSSNKFAPPGGPLYRVGALGTINNIFFDIFYNSNKETSKQDQQIFDQILSTFKFLDQNQTIDSSSWALILTNKTYGYSVKIPNGWSYKENDSGDLSIIPPGADLFPPTQKSTPGEGQPSPAINISIIGKPFNQPDIQTKSAMSKYGLIADGVTGQYYFVAAAPMTWTNFDLPFNNGNKTLRFSFPNPFQDFETFNPKHEPNMAKFDEETFKQIISTFKFTN